MFKPNDYVKSKTAEIKVIDQQGKVISKELLWGDGVKRTSTTRNNKTEVLVHARGMKGFVKKSDLGGKALLEIYFIDVGQGDGVLIVTPDRRHILIDGGWPRKSQPTDKNAADFIDWKFAKDYSMKQIELDTVLCSHNDQDHYGGLWDLFNPEEEEKLDIKTKKVFVERFYHAGLSWWNIKNNHPKPKSKYKKSLGDTVSTQLGTMFSRLLGDRADIIKNLNTNKVPHLQGEWAKFLRCVTKIKKKSGSPTPAQRLSHANEYIPGYEKGVSDVSIKILAPVEFEVSGKPAIRYFTGGTSKNTNGNSLLLRLDYGKTRTLLTGDLNTKSMRSILEDWSGERQELECDIAKACHHGSDDVSYEFLAQLRPAITVISSGDNEGHDHPRPNIIAASATTGHLSLNNDQIETPLIYSTELARSVKFGNPVGMELPKSDGSGQRTVEKKNLREVRVDLEVKNAGQRSPSTNTRILGNSLVVSGIIYGLVNIRSDGETILCATRNEADHTWQTQKVKSRF